MTRLTQENRLAQIFTPLPENTLLLRSAYIEEQLGQLFRFELDLVSEDSNVSPDDLLGKEMSIQLNCGRGRQRFFHGIVNRFTQTTRSDRYFRYHATVVPKLWLLTRTADCRVFQNMNVPDIIEQVCKDSGVEIAERRIGSYTPWEYCVQYRETDFHFLSRLMEQEGIYYFFEHEKSAHRLILADNPGAHVPIPGYEEISFRSRAPLTQLEDQHIRDWAVESRFNPSSFVHTDFDFTKPRFDLRTQSQIEKKTGDGEIFDFPGEYTEFKDGEGWARVRSESIGAGNVLIQGFGDAMGLKAGGLFSLTETPPEVTGGEFLVVSTGINMEVNIFETTGSTASAGGDVFGCTLTAMNAYQTFRPARTTLKPLIRGIQTAIVTGPQGAEIHTDKYGRVKVQFHWDRLGKKDENTSCFIRVAEPWAGKCWGTIFTPRIGQEVVVNFLEGDPDQPLIIGSVYNGEQMPPYELPANKTQSGVKTRSTLNGTPANFNEIRFEDKKGHEQLYIHAERNEDIVVESNKTENVGYDETIKIGHDRTETVGNDQSITIGKDDTLNVAMNQDITIGMQQTETIGANRTTTVGINDTLNVGAARTATIGAADSLSVGGAISITSGGVITITAGAAIAITASTAIAITAPVITLNGRPVAPVPAPI